MERRYTVPVLPYEHVAPHVPVRLLLTDRMNPAGFAGVCTSQWQVRCVRCHGVCSLFFASHYSVGRTFVDGYCMQHSYDRGPGELQGWEDLIGSIVVRSIMRS